MNETRKRKTHKPEFKAKVDLEAVRGVKAISEIAQAYGMHPVLVGQWKREILESVSGLLETKRGPKPTKDNKNRLYSEIGRLKMGADWFKKLGGVSREVRMLWIMDGHGRTLDSIFLERL